MVFGGRRTSSEGGGFSRRKCCILKQMYLMAGYMLFYDKNGNHYSGHLNPTGSVSFDVSVIESITYTMDIREQLCAYCSPLPCKGDDLLNWRNPTPAWSCNDEVEALNQSDAAGASIGGGGGGGHHTDIEAFRITQIAFWKNGCCDCENMSNSKSFQYKIEGEIHKNDVFPSSPGRPPSVSDWRGEMADNAALKAGLADNVAGRLDCCGQDATSGGEKFCETPAWWPRY